MVSPRSLSLVAVVGLWAAISTAHSDPPRSPGTTAVLNTGSDKRPPDVGGVQFDSRMSDKFNSDEPKAAAFKWQKSGDYRIELTTTGGATGEFGDLTPTELWCAYNLVRPSKKLVQLYSNDKGFDLSKPEDYRGLVTAVTEGTAATATLHPVLRGTPVGQSVVQLDLLVAWMKNPPDNTSDLFNKLQSNNGAVIPWKKYGYSRLIWYDAELSIRVAEKRVLVEAADRPAETVLRIRFWHGGEKGHDEFYGSHTHLAYLFETFKPLQDADRLCRSVAILRRLHQYKCLPDLPSSVFPERVLIPDKVQFADFMPK
ncbi:hypothetical protein R5W23_005491 [Gemmata sp. JC673]|uniref:Secreted protein n=1 Tax=Gemmata algarum TaxID=2975278 RepID=A0ABU5ETV4_9BACT|nr:hypothetical protein [Gemmata algarum]MDY3558398.1 hypothetical protein [Gemmata algarum]